LWCPTDEIPHFGIHQSLFRKYRGSHAVVISELKFSDVKRHIFLTDLVEHADHAAFNQRPETLAQKGAECRGFGATESGLCMSCIARVVQDKPMKSLAGRDAAKKMERSGKQKSARLGSDTELHARA